MKVLVTGSTQGIGYALAEAFARRGDDVTVHCSADIKKAEAVRERIGAASAVVCDLSDAGQVESLFSKTGPVDCLILNASVQYKNDWLSVSDSELRKQLEVNFVSTYRLIGEYYPSMKEKGFGRIVAIGSVNVYRNHPELTVYSATKCAVESLIRNIAKQAAPFGVTLNSVSPGAVATPRNRAIYDDPEKRRAVEKNIPVGRFGLPGDIVGAVMMLCSDAGAYITGTDIVIDGGMRL